jgi:hypothetical protein
LDSLDKQYRVVTGTSAVSGDASSSDEDKGSTAGVPSPDSGTSSKKKRSLSRNISQGKEKEKDKDDVKPPSPRGKMVTIKEATTEAVAGPRGDPASAPNPVTAGDDSPSEEDGVKQRTIERELSAKLKSRLLTSDLVSGEEESEDKENGKGGSDDDDDKFESANDDDFATRGDKKPGKGVNRIAKLQKRQTIVLGSSPTSSPATSKSSKKSKRLSAPAPSQDKRTASVMSAGNHKTTVTPMAGAASPTVSLPPLVSNATSSSSSTLPTANPKLVPSRTSPRDVALLSLRIWGVVFVVSFVATLLLPGTVVFSQTFL